MMDSTNNGASATAAISIKAQAAAVGLSRQRFMQLVKVGVFPAPLRDEATGRPYFTAEMQAVCADVRRRHQGINGKIVMFYARRPAAVTAPSRPKASKPAKAKPAADRHADIVAALHDLGLTTATSAQVAGAVAERFPKGLAGVDRGEVIRTIFLHLRRRDSGGNVGSKE